MMIVVSQTTEVFYPVLPGGLAQLYRYGPGLRDRGIQLRVHTAWQREHGEERELTANGVEIVRHALPDGLDHHRERTELIGHALDRMRTDGEGVSHCLQPNGASWRSTAQLWRARARGIPSSFYFTMFPDDPPDRIDRRLRYVLRLRALLAPFSMLIFSSQRMRAAFGDLVGMRPERMVVLPNGVDLQRFSPAEKRGELRRKLGLPEGVPIVLYCGSVIPRKGVDVLLDAWERVIGDVPEARLVILGSVGMRPTFRDQAMRDELIEFTARMEARLGMLQEKNSVVLPGEVEDVGDYCRAADVFAFPSRREGLPNAVLEAMASGLPCVVAPFEGVPDEGEEFGRDGEHFIRSSHEPAAMAADLLGLIRSPAKAEAIGRAARAWMEETQQPERTLDILAGHYRSASGLG